MKEINHSEEKDKKFKKRNHKRLKPEKRPRRILLPEEEDEWSDDFDNYDYRKGK